LSPFAEKVQPMNVHTAAALRVYKARNRILKALEFASYDAYLASPLWAEIRERKLASEGRRCFACGKLATQVHHGGYDKLTLSGPGEQSSYDGAITWEKWLELAELYAVCSTCHEWAEKFLDEPVGPALATRRLRNRRRKNRLDETVPRAARQGRQERRAREMEGELKRLLRRDE
jgi:hypothetical protein